MAERPHDVVAHVGMPFCTPGSTLLAVTEQLARVHRTGGGTPLAVLSDNRGLRTEHAEALLVDHTEHCPREYFARRHLAVDTMAAYLGRPRPFYGRLHEPAVRAVARRRPRAVLLYEGHYAAASLPWWDRLRPETAVLLYLHNPLSRAYPRSELRRMARQCDAMVFCAEHLRDAAQERMGPVDIPLVVIPNGVDGGFREVSWVGPGSDEVEVLFVGRVTPHKGVDRLVAALAEAQRQAGVRLRATVVGSDNYGLDGRLSDYEQGLRRLAEESSVPVTFVAHASREEIAKRMSEAGLVCLPSVWPEGLPLVAIEAMTVGTPVVAFDSAGVVEACGDAACYARTGDVHDLARAIGAVAGSPDLATELSAVGRKRAAAFSWERAWSRFEELLAER